VKDLRGWIARLNSLIPPIPDLPDDPWPDEWGAKLAEAAMDAHGAVLNATLDNELALRSMEIWTDAFEEELRVDPAATRPRLSTFNDDGPVPCPRLEDDDDAADPEGPAALEQLIAQATRDLDITRSSQVP
jgi:hypothetical protein